MINQSGSWGYCNTTGMPDGQYLIQIYANDSTGNMNNTETRYFTIDTADSTPPAVIILVPENATIDYNTPCFNASVEDNIDAYNLLNVTLQVDNINYTMINQSGSWGYCNTTGMPNGQYLIQIYANDSTGNMNDTEIRYFSIDTSIYYPHINIIDADLKTEFNVFYENGTFIKILKTGEKFILPNATTNYIFQVIPTKRLIINKPDTAINLGLLFVGAIFSFVFIVGLLFFIIKILWSLL